MLLIFPLIWRLSYKTFLRFHQILALVAAYALWCHLLVKKLFVCIYMLIAIDLFVTMMFWQVLQVLFHNLVLDHAFVQTDVTQINGMIKINLILSQSWTVQAGQYVNICISFISTWFFLQSHSFMIAFWTEDSASDLFLLASVKADFTRKLLQYVQPHSGDSTDSDYQLAWFSRSHELTLNLDDYSSVTMIAISLDIAAQLPYLKELIKGYNNCKVWTHQIQLIWQIATWDEYFLTHTPSRAGNTNTGQRWSCRSCQSDQWNFKRRRQR